MTPCTHVVNLNVACEFRLTDYGKIVFDVVRGAVAPGAQDIDAGAGLGVVPTR